MEPVPPPPPAGDAAPMPEPFESAPDDNRIGGLDAARAIAILGMVMVHFGPSSPPPDDWLSWLYGLPHGRASVLFVLLAGIGMSLLAGQRNRERWRRAWPRLVTRVAILLPLGLALQLLDIQVGVILHYYAIFFLLAMPATLLGDRALLLVAIATSIAGPVMYSIIARLRPEWLWRYNQVALDDSPAVIARELLLTGFYPPMVWMAPFLFGMWLGRRRLRNAGVRLGVLIGGAITAGACAWLGANLPGNGWWALADPSPHSQTIVWIVGSTASGAAILAICLLITDFLGRLMWPLVAMGQLALTIYVSHILVLAAAPSTFTTDEVEPALAIVFVFAVSAALFAVIWRAWFSRGPLEALFNLPARYIEHRRARKENPGLKQRL